MRKPRPCPLVAVFALTMATGSLAFATAEAQPLPSRPPTIAIIEVQPTATAAPFARPGPPLVDLEGLPVNRDRRRHWLSIESIVVDACRATAGADPAPLLATPCAALHGEVVDSHGDPVGGAHISVDLEFDYRIGDATHHLQVAGNCSTTTNANGTFHLPRAPIGCRASLIVSHPRFEPARRAIPTPARCRVRVEPSRAEATGRTAAPPDSQVASHIGPQRWIQAPAPQLAVTLVGLDAQGRPQPIWTATSKTARWSRQLAESCGFGFPSTTRTLVFRTGERVLGRIHLAP